MKQKIEVPELMQSLPIYDGLPVPWFCTWNEDGEPLLTGVDAMKLRMTIRQGVCGACSASVRVGEYWAISTPKAFSSRVNVGLWMHEQCCKYVLHAYPAMFSKPLQHLKRDVPDLIIVFKAESFRPLKQRGVKFIPAGFESYVYKNGLLVQQTSYVTMEEYGKQLKPKINGHAPTRKNR